MFHGSIPALITPFNESGNVDWGVYESLIDWHIRSGSHGLLVLGTTGESPTLDTRERRELIRRAVATIDGRIPLLVGTGHNATQTTCTLTQQAADLGADGALVVTPYYNRPTQIGLIKHYHDVAESSPIPLLIYNVPSRTGCDILPETVGVLAAHERIVGIKDATPDTEALEAMLEWAPDDFLFLTGNDALMETYVMEGGDGVISVIANLIPDIIAGRMRNLLEDEDEGDPLPPHVLQLIDAMGWETNPIPIKWALWHLGIIRTPQLRLPLTTLTTPLQPRLQALLEPLK